MFLLPRHLARSLPSSASCSSAVSLRLLTYSHSIANMDSIKQKMAGLTPFAKKHKVTVVGSGNWGSTIAKLVAENTAAYPDLFERDVQMWVYEEDVEISKDSKHYNESSELCKGPVKLTRVINEVHENIRYLPNIPLPSNLIANPDIKDSVKDSTILIFNMPHQFIEKQCGLIKGRILPFARGISCIKGVNVQESSVSLFSETIGQELGIYCGALSGANIANEVAQEKFSETTIAYDPPAMDSQAPTPATSRGPSPSASHADLTKIEHKDVHGKPSKIKLTPMPAEYHTIDHTTIKKLFHRRYFHVRVVSDVAGVSIGGALKNVIALAAGWVDGLGWGDNAKAAIMRVGLLEMLDFGKRFFSKTVHAATFTEESAGVADLITTCNGGRHVRCAKKSILEGKSIAEIEARDLNGQKLQGTLTAYEVYSFLKIKGVEKDFPLMTAVHDILEGKAKPEDLPDLIDPEEETASQSPSNDTLADYKHGLLENPPVVIFDAATRSQSEAILGLPPNDTSGNDNFSSPSSILIPPPALASSRYNRQLLLPQISLAGQQRILSSCVLIIGLGGLGSPSALYLAGAGVSTLGFVDGDVVEGSNLHRQVVHREDSIGLIGENPMTKVESAIRGCGELNSELNYIAHGERLSTSNALEIIQRYDIVLDCTDNPATRYLINDACVILGKTLVSGAAQRLEGQMVVLNYPILQNPESADRGPCYRCIFPNPPPPDMVQSCSEIGILGPVVGCIGTIMASECLRLIVEASNVNKEMRKPSMLLYNAWPSDPKTMYRTILLAGRRKGCVACGDVDVLEKMRKTKITRDVLEKGDMNYEAWCGRLEDVKILEKKSRIGASELLQNLAKGQGLVVVDVREDNERIIGAKLPGTVNIPISKILRDPETAFGESLKETETDAAQALRNDDGEDEKDFLSAGSMVFLCYRGNDSQIAAQKLVELDQKAGRRRRGWIGDVEGGFFALEKASASMLE